MKCEIINIGDRLGKYYMFYNAPALLSNHNRDREFGTVIAEAKTKLIVVDDEIIREHVYLIPKTKVDHCSEKQVYFNIPENSLNEFEI
jgi:hypothetical protein